MSESFENNNRNRSIKKLKAEAKDVVSHGTLSLIKLS